jgi:rare lipoprotein A
MKFVLVTALLAVLVMAGKANPAAAAGASDHLREKDIRDRSVLWTDDGPPKFERRRVARATTSDADEDYDIRPRQRYQLDDADQARSTPRRQARSVKRSKQHQVTRRSTREAARHRSDRRSAERRTTRRIARSERAVRTARSDFGSRLLSGIASYYWQDQRVATGARFNPEGMTAAHRTLPFGTRVRVTHLGNGRSVNVVINDRGPYIAGRIIDLARGAARVIGMTGQGLARVNVTVLGR